MKSKWIVLLIALVFALSLGMALSCDDDDDDDDDNDDSSDDDSSDDDASDDDDSGGDVWTDSTSGLMWQNGDDCCPRYEWEDAIEHCENLSWGGFSDWHLPSISELRSLIRGCEDTESDGSCGLTDSCLDSSCWNQACSGCSDAEGPANGCYWPSEINGDCSWYWHWSSSAVADMDSAAWDVHFSSGHVSINERYFDYIARCVR